MTQSHLNSAQLRRVAETLQNYWWLWTAPAALMTVLATGYALTRSPVWKASQGLLVRDEAGGNLSRPGRFDSSDAMKTAQETVLEMARNPIVVAAALVEVGPPNGYRNPDRWPTPDDVASTCGDIAVAPPKGAEFGRTEVIYLSAKSGSRERAVALTAAVCDQLELRLKSLRSSRAESLIDELVKATKLARADLEASTAQLEAIEKQVGSDLGELRILNTTGAGDSNLRSALNQIKNELRQANALHQAQRQQMDLLVAAQRDPNRLTQAPQSLLDSQPALKRLKDGLVDAQLRTAQLASRMSEAHPEVQAASAAEAEVRQDLNQELDTVVRSLQAEIDVSGGLVRSLRKQSSEVEGRLSRLAGLRARYSNLAAEVQHCSETLVKTQKDLSEARANQAAALSVSVITRIDKPDPGVNPTGPSGAQIVMSGFAGGLATGFGLVFLVAPIGPNVGRRLGDYLRGGRRSSDRPTAPTTTVAANQPAGSPDRRQQGRRQADLSTEPPRAVSVPLPVVEMDGAPQPTAPRV